MHNEHTVSLLADISISHDGQKASSGRIFDSGLRSYTSVCQGTFQLIDDQFCMILIYYVDIIWREHRKKLKV